SGRIFYARGALLRIGVEGGESVSDYAAKRKRRCRLERSCVEPLRLLVWHTCRLCPNNSAAPSRLFTDRNRAGFWRRSCASSEIWISPKRRCTRRSLPLWSPGLGLVFRTSRDPG